MNWEDKKQQRLFKAYFEKTGIQLVDEPIYDSDWEKDNLEKLVLLAQTRPIAAIPKLEKLVDEKPHIPALKNYLQVAYTLGGKTEKADALGTRTLKEHPNYLFGITSKILNTIDKEELEKIGHLLGKPRDVREIEGYDKSIHISAFKNYQYAAAWYETIMKEDKIATDRLESLMDVGVEDDFIHMVAHRLALARVQNFHDRLTDLNAKKIVVKSFQKVYLTPDNTPPIFNSDKLNVLYTKDVNSFEKSTFDEIFQLPRISLIEDLEKVLEDSMKRWTEHYQYTEYDASTHDFPVHALYFLGALKSESSLPKVLDLIRMGEKFVDYWFSDSFEELLYPSLYALGEGQLEILKEFAIEENIDGFHKSIISGVVSQVALHQTERREEVIKWYSTVFQIFLDQPTNDNLIDTIFLNFCVENIVNFRGIELLPIIEKLAKNSWLNKTFQGDLNEIKEALQEPSHPSDLQPLPKNLEEYYTRKYIERKIINHFSLEPKTLNNQSENKAEQLILDKFSGLLFGKSGEEEDFDDDFLEDDFFYKEPVKTVVRKTPKIGRNDPCTCGSGKKYKKCCLRK